MTTARPEGDGGSAAKAVGSSRRDSLEQTIRELQQNARYRSLFLSRLAHELRTPLTSILGFSEILLSQEKLTNAQRGFCERIQSSAHQLQASLNQLSDLARLEVGQTKLSQQRLAVDELVRDVLPALARSAEKKRVLLTCAGSCDLPDIVSDRACVRLIIYNLLANAIARSPEGAVVKSESAPSAHGVAITFTDSGDPIPDPLRVGILDADDNSGTGELGVSIARHNLEILGGSLEAQNDEGEVRYIVSLPLHPPA